MLIATGWGKTNATSEPAKKLRQVVVPIQPGDQEPGCEYRTPHFIKEKQLCAGGVGNPKKGACVSDSGGPLVRERKKNNRWFQYGVISGGWEPCGEETAKAGNFREKHYLLNLKEHTLF